MKITENDIRFMIKECVEKILNERDIIRHTHGDYEDWDGDDERDDEEEEEYEEEYEDED